MKHESDHGSGTRSGGRWRLNEQRDRQVHFLAVDEPRQSEEDSGAEGQMLAQRNDARKAPR